MATFTVPRNVRDGKSNGCANHGSDFGRVVLIHGKGQKRDANVISQILREQRTNGTVDHTRGKNRLGGRSALAAIEASGNTTNGVQSLFVVHGEGEKINSVSGSGGCGSVGKDTSIAVAYQARSVGELADFSRLNHKRPTGVFVFEYSVIFKHIDA